MSDETPSTRLYKMAKNMVGYMNHPSLKSDVRVDVALTEYGVAFHAESIRHGSGSAVTAECRLKASETASDKAVLLAVNDAIWSVVDRVEATLYRRIRGQREDRHAIEPVERIGHRRGIEL